MAYTFPAVYDYYCLKNTVNLSVHTHPYVRVYPYPVSFYKYCICKTITK